MNIGREEEVAVAVDATLRPSRAAVYARRVQEALAAVPPAQQTWIVTAGADDVQTAAVAAAVGEVIGAADLVIHDPQDADALVFQARYPGERRGGIYLNARWQAASVRIVIGEAERAAEGMAAWFNAGRVEAAHLAADWAVPQQ